MDWLDDLGLGFVSYLLHAADACVMWCSFVLAAFEDVLVSHLLLHLGSQLLKVDGR